MYQHLQVIEKAKSRGIKVTDLSNLMQAPFALLEGNGISELLNDGVPTSWINVRSQHYCDNKQLAKRAFDLLGIPYPKSVNFKSGNEAELATFMQPGKSYVCKPLDGCHGIGVVTEIRDLEMVQSYRESYKELTDNFILEEQLGGADLRIHVLGGKIAAACIREPAFVLGNGVDSLEALIEQRRAVMHTQNPNNFLEINPATESLLIEQAIGLRDVPAADRKIRLKKVSNMAQGGIATDVTEEIHPMYHDWAASLCAYLKTGYLGMDFMTPDYTKHPIGVSCILEVNAHADWLHHTFSERRTHDISGMILTEIFGNE